MSANPFKPLGARLRDFARGKINRYLPDGEVSTRPNVAPSWANNAAAPLDWESGGQSAIPQPGTVDFSSFETHTETSVPASYLSPSSPGSPAAPSVQTKPADAAPAPEQAKPMSRLDFLNHIWAMREAQLNAGRKPAPDPDTENVQRSADEGAAPPRPIGRRRRGAVVDVPVARPPETTSDSVSPNAPDSPDFFFVGSDDASPDAAPPSVQAMRTSPPDSQPVPLSQVQRSAAPSSESSTAPSQLPAASPWGSVATALEHSASVSASTEALLSGESSDSPAPLAQNSSAQSSTDSTPSVQRSTGSSSGDMPSVQRSPDTSSAGANTPSPQGEASSIIYMPADRVTYTESSPPSELASPAIQKSTIAAPDATHAQPAEIEYHGSDQPRQAQEASTSTISNQSDSVSSAPMPGIQPARADEIDSAPSLPDSAFNVGAGKNVSYSAPPQPSTPAVQLQRSSQSEQPAPPVQQTIQRETTQPSGSPSKSRKSQAAQQTAPAITASDLSGAAAESSDVPAPIVSNAIQRDIAETSPAPDTPTPLSPQNTVPATTQTVQRSIADAPHAPDTPTPLSSQNTAPAPTQTVQRTSDSQPESAQSSPTTYTGLPSTAFNTPQMTDSASAAPPDSSPSSQSAGVIQRKKPDPSPASPSVKPGGNSQVNTPAYSPERPQPSAEVQREPVEFIESTSESAFTAESPTLLTPTASVQRGVENTPASAETPSISRYTDFPDAAFNTPSNTSSFASSPANTVVDPHYESHSQPAPPATSAASKSKTGSTIQRRRGVMGVSYTPTQNADDALQRETDEASSASTAPSPVWTPSTELAPPSPSNFAEPSPWTTYMEAPAFEEPPKPAPRIVSSGAPETITPAPVNKPAVQRASENSPVETASQYSALPDSSFMSAAPASSAAAARRGTPEMGLPNTPSAASYTAASPTTASVQRSIQSEADPLDESALPVHDFDISDAFNSNFIDSSQSSTPAQPPSISRAAESSISSAPASPQFSHNFTPNANIPSPESVEAGMLKMLNLPPDTPVIGLKPAPATPEISRKPEDGHSAAAPSTRDSNSAHPFQSFAPAGNFVSASPAPTATASPTPQDHGSDAIIQRAIGEDQAPAETTNDSQSNPEEGGSEPDVEELAKEVYKVLRSKLRNEHERRHGS
ncbi:MAG: hypothetical protein IAE89_13870 [Anaerolineae bacterium]|nr:hypothetical protein [Anaerolineae bacterium]